MLLHTLTAFQNKTKQSRFGIIVVVNL